MRYLGNVIQKQELNMCMNSTCDLFSGQIATSQYTGSTYLKSNVEGSPTRRAYFNSGNRNDNIIEKRIQHN